MNQLTNIQFALPVGSINSYVHSVNQVPILSVDEEQRLQGYYKRRVILMRLES